MYNHVDSLVDNWLIEKLDDWYCKFYDLENKEYQRIKSIINNHFTNTNLSILEVGCGTGRLTKQLAQDFSQIKGIDVEEKYIKYCKKNNQSKNSFYETKDIRNFQDNTKYDVIIFSWIGLHYQENLDKIITKIESISKENTLVLVLDAYYDSQYVQILQEISPVDLTKTKLLKEQLNESLISHYNNFNQEVLQTKYIFDTIDNVINNFKVELTLEESYDWSDEDEKVLKEYLEKKSNPLVIGEALWITQCTNLKTTPNP